MAHFRKYKTSKGETRYRVEVRIKGAKPVSKVFFRLTDAKLWAAKEEETSQRLGAGIQERRQRTVSEAVDRYLDEHASTLRSRVTAERCLRWWKREIGARYLNCVTVAELIDLRKKLATEPKRGNKAGYYNRRMPLQNPDGSPIFRKPKTVQHYMDYLANLYNKAFLEWGWADKNPVRSIKKLPVNNERTRFLSDHVYLWPGDAQVRNWGDLNEQERAYAKLNFPRAYELPRLIEALKGLAARPKYKQNRPMWAYYLFVIQLETGLRVSEALNLVWEENSVIQHPIVIVDMARQVLILKSTKSDTRPRTKPLCGRALEVLHELYKERLPDSPLVFHGTDKQKPFKLVNRLQQAVKDAGLEDFRWHDLRHTTASYLSMMGAGQREIMEAMHHRTMKSSQRYQHLSTKHLRGLMTRFSQTILVEEQSPSRFAELESA